MSSKYAADEQRPEKASRAKCLPATTQMHDSNTPSEPQGCGGQHGWNERGYLLGGWAVQSGLSVTALPLLGAPTPASSIPP